jgi:uncharacterized protein (TIGR03067 family)
VNATHFKLTGRGTANGQFHLNPQANPKEFDWEGTGTKGNHHKWVGIYDLEGNRFRLCYRGDARTKPKTIPRPAWSEAQAADVVYLEFEKVD